MNIYTEIQAERERQKKKWPSSHDDNHTTFDWIAIITRYLGEASIHGDRYTFDIQKFRDTMIKVGALTVACIEWADRILDGEDT